MKKPKNRALLLALAALLLGGAGLWALLRPQPFPLWEPAQEMEPVPGIVSWEYVSMEPASSTSVDIHMEVTTDRDLDWPSVYRCEEWIEYCQNGEWHVVYRHPRPKTDMIPADALIFLAGTHDVTMDGVPKQLFQRKGSYRYGMYFLPGRNYKGFEGFYGYCYIEVE